MADFAISTSGTAASVALPFAIRTRSMAAPGIPAQELWLLANPAELKTARRFAESAAEDFGLGKDVRFRFKLAVNEAVANAIEHGEPSADGRLQLRISSYGNLITFEVRDWGSFSAARPQEEKLQERGRGLAMMASLVDEVDLRRSDGSTVVRLRVRAT